MAVGHDVWFAARVRKDGNRKAVIIPSLDLNYAGETLQVR